MVGGEVAVQRVMGGGGGGGREVVLKGVIGEKVVLRRVFGGR